MRFAFAGGMTISERLLRTLCEAGAVPDHVFGYPTELSHRSNYCALDGLSLRYGFPLSEVKDINHDSVKAVLKAIRPDWFCVFGWSQLLDRETLQIPRLGTLGIHISKLPEGRGRAPVAWNLIHGNRESAVTFMLLKPEADNGDIVAQRVFPIWWHDDAATLVDRVNDVACGQIAELLPAMREGNLPHVPQDDAQATYWPRRTPADGLLDWNQTARKLYDFIRGTTRPFPGAFTYLNELKVTVWKAGWLEASTPQRPGTILGPVQSHGAHAECGLAVAASGGILILWEVETAAGSTFSGTMLADQAEEWKGLAFGGPPP